MSLNITCGSTDRLLMAESGRKWTSKHQYDEDQKGKKSPFWIEGLKPIQIATFNLDEYRQCRGQFSTDEWIDLLLRSIGMEPAHFSRKTKLLFLIRLLPLCEHNYNLVELGPRAPARATPTRNYRPTRSC